MQTSLERPVETLGPLEKSYAVSWADRWANFLAITLLLGIGGFVALAAMGGGMTQDPAGRAICAGLAIFVLILAGLILFFTVRHGRWRIDLHSEGLVHRQGEAVEVFAWEDVESMLVAITQVRFHGIPIGKTKRHTLQRPDGRRLVLTEKLTGVDELAARVQAETGRRLLPAALRRVASGESVAFGKKLIVNHQGLVRGGKTLEWSRLGRISVSAGMLSIRAQGRWWWPWTRLAYRRVPNAAVFLQLVETLRAEGLHALDPITTVTPMASAPSAFQFSR